MTSSTISRSRADEHCAFRRPSLLGVLWQRVFNAKGVSIPVAVSVFPDELYPLPGAGRSGMTVSHRIGVPGGKRVLGLDPLATGIERAEWAGHVRLSLNIANPRAQVVSATTES